MEPTNKLKNIFAQSGEIVGKDSSSKLFLGQEAIPECSAVGTGLFSYFNVGVKGNPAPAEAITI